MTAPGENVATLRATREDYNMVRAWVASRKQMANAGAGDWLRIHNIFQTDNCLLT